MTTSDRSLQKNWAKCIELWNAELVPEIEVVPYSLKRPTGAPWRNRDNIHVCDSNPLRSTAYHLSLFLLDKPFELSIAYKLNAFRVHYQQHLEDSVLRYAFSSCGSEPWGWWGQNSRNVLPPVSQSDIREFEPLRFRYLKSMIPVAAREWHMIAEQWVIVRTPDLMIEGSDEKKMWDKHCEEIAERLERAEYERLKKKFENTNT